MNSRIKGTDRLTSLQIDSAYHWFTQGPVKFLSYPLMCICSVCAPHSWWWKENGRFVVPEEQWTRGKWRVATVASQRRGGPEPMAVSASAREGTRNSRVGTRHSTLCVVVPSCTCVLQCGCSKTLRQCVRLCGILLNRVERGCYWRWLWTYFI